MLQTVAAAYLASPPNIAADATPDARLAEWSDTAHLPSMERPDDFLALLRDLAK